MKVLLALEKLLESYPIEQITSGRLAREAGISRSTFYRQYSSVDDVLVQLFDHVIDEMVVASDGWISGTDPLLRPSLRGLHKVFLNHGPLLRAVVDAEVGELTATSERYRGVMAMWDEAVSLRLQESYPWVPQPDLIAHALNAADERLMYYQYGDGPESVSEEHFNETFDVMYGMWCSAMGIQPGSETRVDSSPS
jgi:AcrR family transcriptional regulator